MALEFVERRRDRVEFAERIHSRTDVAWTPLIATSTQEASDVWSCGELPSVQHDMSKTMVM
jgi:hypothetical protein